MSVVDSLTPEEAQYFESQGEQAPPEAEQYVIDEPPESSVEDQQQIAGDGEQPPAGAEAEDKTPKMVRLEALHEAREKNRELRQQMEEERKARQALEARFAQVMERLAPQQQGTAQPPSFDERPADYLRQKVEGIERAVGQTAQQIKQQEAESKLRNWYSTQAANFAQTKPDFGDAYTSWVSGRAEQLRNAGMGDQQIAQRIEAEERVLVVAAAQTGRNPAALIYGEAIANGWMPVQARQSAPEGQDNAARLKTVAKGVESSKSLSNVSGRPAENLTLEALADMSDEDFDKYWHKVMGQG